MKWLLLLYLTKGADTLSTEAWVINNPYLREANPLMRSSPARISLTIGAPLAVYYTGKKLPKKWRVLLYVGASGAWSYAVMHNYKLGREVLK